ncbi:MAG: 30S ribosomal protein S17 [Patescibacteria group bacterium]|nr:30S ribosomal protein S17 [Patescibacteria group bacterium]
MKTLKGEIISLAREKTAAVLVNRLRKHPLYKKYVKKSKKYACHYENMELKLGDKVEIQECRPISKTKHFRVVAKIENK